MEKVNAIGRRKAAVARVYLTEGTGNITIDKRPLDVYFPSSILQYVVKQPLLTLDAAEKYDIVAHLDGGGYKGQAEALRLAIARALVKVDPEDKAAPQGRLHDPRRPRGGTQETGTPQSPQALPVLQTLTGILPLHLRILRSAHRV